MDFIKSHMRVNLHRESFLFYYAACAHIQPPVYRLEASLS